jgi:predicted nucleic acid-binding protein
VYIDTSAVGRVLLGEPDSAAILEAIGAYETRAASRLVRLELLRLALRHDVVTDAERLLGGIALVPVDQDTLTAAETIDPHEVATLDAIDLVTAIRLAHAGHVDAVMTYDRRLAAGAVHHGLAVISPGASAA